MAAVPTGAAPGVYKARRPQASPPFRLVSDHFRAFHHAYDERFAPAYGDWRPVVREVADKSDEKLSNEPATPTIVIHGFRGSTFTRAWSQRKPLRAD